jgi:hypothetical protein
VANIKKFSLEIACSACNDRLTAEVGMDNYGTLEIMVDPCAACVEKAHAEGKADA